jgi:hypothetical protein
MGEDRPFSNPEGDYPAYQSLEKIKNCFKLFFYAIHDKNQVILKIIKILKKITRK